MSGTSKNPLLRRAEELTSRHAQGGPAVKPPVVAAQSPLHELLIHEIAASLPSEVATRMYAAPMLEEAQAWIAAGAIYNSLADEPYLASEFLKQVADDPRQAGLALARAYSHRMEPPPRDLSWHVRDRLGQALQLTVGVGTLLCRVVVFLLLGWYAHGNLPAITPPELAQGLAAGSLLRGEGSHWKKSVALALGTIWLSLEALVAPLAMEKVRRFPALRNGLPPPLAWRASTFLLLWRSQALGLMAWLFLRGFGWCG